MVFHKHEPITVCAKGLNYWIVKKTRQGEERTQIIHDVDLIVKPGQLLAIMGPSGSGKTTLMNLIAGRVTGGEREGSIYFNGKANAKNRKKFVSYVMQSDCLLEFLTVEETLRLNATLKLKHKKPEERMERVEKVIAELGLQKCRGTAVGGPMKKGISGGEKKRVSIATELLDDPALLCLDEPTSGLDAALAYDMLKLLVQLAKGGRTIICTVHQPRSQVFALFDQLLLLSRGRVVYQGPAVDADAYFDKHGYVCPAHFNPADFLLDILTETRASELGEKADNGSSKIAPAPLGDEEGNNDKATTEDGPDAQPDAPPDAPPPPAADNHALLPSGSKGRINITGAEIERFPELFHQCDLAKRIEDQVDKELDKRSEGGMTAAPPKKITLESVKQTLSGFWLEVRVLAKRTVLNSVRNPLKAMGDVSQNIFMGFILGAIFWQLGDSGLSDAQNRAGAIFFIAVNFAFATFSVMMTFAPERALLNRDTANGIHGVLSYFVAKDIGELLFVHFPPTCFCAIFYFMVGLRPGIVYFLKFLLISNITVFASFALMVSVAAASPSPDIGNIFIGMLMVILMLTSGYYLKDGDIPPWIAWIKYISYIRYSFFGIMVNEFEGNDRFQDDIDGGDGVLEFFDLEKQNFWTLCFILLGLGVGFRGVAFLCLQYLNRKQGLEL